MTEFDWMCLVYSLNVWLALELWWRVRQDIDDVQYEAACDLAMEEYETEKSSGR